MEKLLQNSVAYLQMLCNQITDRSVGSEGNRAATRYFESIASSLVWNTETQEFDAMDWIDGGASFHCGMDNFQVFVSPYSLGCTAEGQLISVSSIEELERATLTGKILLLHGEIAKEQPSPKNFLFYNPEEHQHIISLLEKGEPKAIICATGRNACLAGGVYPFPLIEDGDFDIPSVFMTDEEGDRLAGRDRPTAPLGGRARGIPHPRSPADRDRRRQRRGLLRRAGGSAVGSDQRRAL